jgi:hypothetical protein
MRSLYILPCLRLGGRTVRSERTGSGSGESGSEVAGPGALISEWKLERGDRCGGSERPLRASGPDWKRDCGESQSTDPESGKTACRGAERRIARRFRLRLFSAVHAGGEQG